jgi:hypothetical protein
MTTHYEIEVDVNKSTKIVNGVTHWKEIKIEYIGEFTINVESRTYYGPVNPSLKMWSQMIIVNGVKFETINDAVIGNPEMENVIRYLVKHSNMRIDLFN